MLPDDDNSSSPYRKAARSIGLYSLGIAAGRAVSFLLLPLYTYCLTRAEYGTLELLDLTIQVFTTLIWANFPYAIWYYYTKASDEDRRRETISTALWGAMLFGATGIGVMWLLAGRVSGAVFQSTSPGVYLRLLVVGAAFSLPLETVLCWLRIRDKAGLYVAAGMGRLVVQSGLTLILLLVFGWRIFGAVCASVTATSLTALAAIAYALRANGWAFDGRLLRRMIRYAAPTILVTMAGFVIHFGDRFFLQRTVPMSEVGVYALAYKFGMLITFVQYAFQTYWGAQAFNVAKMPSGEVVFGRMLTYFAWALCWCALAVALLARPVIQLLTPPSYAAAAPLVPVILAGYVLYGLATFVRSVFYVSKRPGVDAALIVVSALVAGVGYAVLIPRYRLWGAAIATLLSFLSMLVLVLTRAESLRHIRFEYGRLMRIVLPALAIGGLVYVQPRQEPVAVQIGVALVLLAGYTAVALTAGVTAQEKAFARRQLGQLRVLWSGFPLRWKGGE